MNKVPLFSIIMPTHNRASLISIGIESILKQTCEDWELILIDDGSTDATKAVITAYSDVRINYIFQEHQERSTARNKGIDLAQGRYICFIDDDDYLLPDHLETFQRVISKDDLNPPILRIGYFREQKNKRTRSALYQADSGSSPALFAARHFCGVWSLAIPKIYLKEHQFPPDFRHWQDTHLILRLLAIYPFRQVAAYTYVYVIHEKMGSLQAYHEPDAPARIESNVAAIQHLFKNYASIIEPTLPAYMHDFLVCQKYCDHAHGALVSGQLGLAWELFRRSMAFNSGGWFYWLYFKFLLKLPLKALTGYPKVS